MRFTSGKKPMSSMRGVDFVEHEDVDVLERGQLPLLQMVEQAAASAAAKMSMLRLQVFQLFPIADAASIIVTRRSVNLANFWKRLLDLHGEFARGLEDEHAQRAVAPETLDDRERKRGRLAGAGLGGTDDIAAGENEGDGLRLNGRRRDL